MIDAPNIWRAANLLVKRCGTRPDWSQPLSQRGNTVPRMIDDLDILHAANILIKRHGPDATIVAARWRYGWARDLETNRRRRA
jgi:hypothetical protein